MRQTVLKAAPIALAVAAFSSASFASDPMTEQRLNAMQQQINALQTTNVRFNGFLSTGYARADNDVGFDGVTEKTRVNDLSLFALQGTFRVSDKSQAVVQIVGRGADDWEPVVEWAYLSHRPTNNLQVRAGKMRLPFFMYSDSLEVGYAQPWVRPPEAVYGPIAITSYVGADATYTFNFDGSSLNAQVFTGFTDEEGTVGNAELRNLGGITLQWTDFTWTLRAVAATAETTIDATNSLGTFLATADRGNFYGIGAGYDDGSLQIIGEVTRVEVDNLFADTDSAYLSVGYRFGTVTPYAKVGWIESKDDKVRQGVSFAGGMVPANFLDTRRDEYSLGARWDITPGVALKADWTHARNFRTDPGGLDQAFVRSTGTNSTNVYTFKLDSAF
ncbi:MAG: hypothetical protein LAT63_05375 [Marinobacter sp.]|nr:hypothetical protein [Marinobacter sp.]